MSCEQCFSELCPDHNRNCQSPPASFPCRSKSSLLTLPCRSAWLSEHGHCSVSRSGPTTETETLTARSKRYMAGVPRQGAEIAPGSGWLAPVYAWLATVSGQGQEDRKQCTKAVTYPPSCITQISSCLPVNSFSYGIRFRVMAQLILSKAGYQGLVE